MGGASAVQFYLEARGLHGPAFRLRTDGAWARCEPRVFGGTDLLTPDAEDLLRYQTPDASVTIDGIAYRLGPTKASLNDRHVLFYQALVLRTGTAPRPSLEQLTATIAEGNGDRSNALILDHEGLFHLVDPSSISMVAQDPRSVARVSTFQAGDAEVGPKAARNERHVRQLFVDLLDQWITHLRTGRTNLFEDEHSSRKLDTLLAELDRS